ncbi:glucosaminidase domain-containing protein [Aureispira sp. CCB-QB1]|uniref:glucosaminidase domain-containing protein n=1 Tax=Aureispira sp. CCB-QB1 TaxID=1313421 RepID=UPI000695A932|nr:glucosaminidase domain-containing protein [Aureispira sp. CCB-QB1]
MQRNTYFILAILASLSNFLFAQNLDKGELTVDEYISKYKDIAIQEMERSGIPASITLAQGIHESAYGNSRLAKSANNHFGIKCTSDWEGKKEYKWDDEARKSCFRVYVSADDSYVDHTDFLLNRKHYAFLFDYDRSDYKRWAKGLKKAGYATDPKYPDKLIKTIEKYKLAEYDKATGILTYDTSNVKGIKNLPIYASSGKHRTKPRSFFFKSYKPGFYRINGATYAISRKGESALAVAKRFGIPYKRFLKFNDLEDGDNLLDYQPAYIQPKRSVYKGEETFYRVEKDITMYEIAQEFGIKLSSLLEMNLLEKGEEPENGELILLKEKALTKPKLRPKNHVDLLPSPYIDDEKAKKLKSPVKSTTKLPTKVVVPKVERPKPQDIVINTPTYDNTVYADTTKINTSKSKDKEFLNVNISAGGSSTTNNTGSSSTNTVIRRPRPTSNGSNSTHTHTSGNRTNPDALFPSTTTTTTTTKGTTNTNNSDHNTTTNTTSNTTTKPTTVYNGNSTGNSSNYGSTKDYQKGNTTTSTTTTVTTPTTTRFITHVVQKGETLYRLHKNYKVSVESIQQANNLTSTVLNVGSVLKIPVK